MCLLSLLLLHIPNTSVTTKKRAMAASEAVQGSSHLFFFFKLEYFKSDLFCGNANPLSISPSHLLLAPVGVLDPRDQVPALSGDGLQGVDEVVGPVRAAAADLFLKKHMLYIYLGHELLSVSKLKKSGQNG